MTTHLSLYPNDGPPVYITIKYVSMLDGAEIGGVWDVETNHIALNWRMYSEFVNIETQKDKKHFFDSLHKVSNYLI